MTILPLASSEADLHTAGGKGASLARLTRAGFPVPPGFVIPTDAYRAFVKHNDLAKTIVGSIAELSKDDPTELERAATHIRTAFSAGEIPLDIETAVKRAYVNLGRASVAVRSSATTEDLPDLSFAGQQDTYLNVLGDSELLVSIVNCWSSLWTARAIGYRIRNGIGHDEIALAVVVQEMVESEISGVLFTANPLTGLLSESVIDAAFGLGEALVSGQVEPDHFVVDDFSGEIVERTLGEKKVSTRPKADGGVKTVAEDAEARQTLSDEEIQGLAALGQDVQREFGAPQDIEWALANGNLYVVQSRPITSLFPVPDVSFDPLEVWFSFGAVQGLVGPMTPLGRDTIRNLAARGGRMFGLRIKPEEVEVLAPAGERLWIKVSDVIRHPIGGRALVRILGFIEPSVAQILEQLIADPRLGAGTGKLKLSTLTRLARFALPVLARLAINALRPEKARHRFDALIEASLATAKIEPAADRHARLANIVAFIRERVANAFSFLLPRFIPILGPSVAALKLLDEVANENRALSLEVTRGLPGNVTAEMDLNLWEIAALIGADAESASVFRGSEAGTLARRYQRRDLPAAAQAAIERFMGEYGMRGVREVDLGQPRWREDPTSVMRTLQSYLNIDAESAPDVLFERGEQAAYAAIEELATEARSQSAGWLKEKLVRAAARRVRLLMGARESPKFYVVRLMGIARSALLSVGKEFAQAETVDQPDDLVFLQLSDLESLARNEPRNWKSRIAERRAAYAREQRRRQVPRVLVSDGRAFYEGLGAETDSASIITGSPVSPGTVEGIVHVVFDPNGTQLSPGDILVCPGTDPAWTPLFMAASGLVMEVGGMMTHGSVVAREYGIPAVVGVHQATERLQDGQKIRLDGTTGRIVLLDE